MRGELKRKTFSFFEQRNEQEIEEQKRDKERNAPINFQYYLFSSTTGTKIKNLIPGSTSKYYFEVLPGIRFLIIAPPVELKR